MLAWLRKAIFFPVTVVHNSDQRAFIWLGCWLRAYLEGNHYNVSPPPGMFATTDPHFEHRGSFPPSFVNSETTQATHASASSIYSHLKQCGGLKKTHTHTTNPHQFLYLCLNSVASLRPEQRLTHFVSLCNKAAMISLLAFCGYLCANSICGKPSISLANIGRVSSYQHRLASSLPGLRSSTFIQADT